MSIKKRGAYYNEWDPYCAQWLRNLIKRRAIPEGDVDERSIEDVRPQDVTSYQECHWFAGIGVWAYALRIAKRGRKLPVVWTASLPCQPFSSAGCGLGHVDERHLWPYFEWLVRFGQPQFIFGEQVASIHTKEWLDLVQTDLEALGYAAGAASINAAGFGAPHKRQRLYWMAVAQGSQYQWAKVEALAIQYTGPGKTLRSRRSWPAGVGPTSNVNPAELLSAYNGVARRLAEKQSSCYGNAIVAPVAIEFIKATLEVIP